MLYYVIKLFAIKVILDHFGVFLNMSLPTPGIATTAPGMGLVATFFLFFKFAPVN